MAAGNLLEKLAQQLKQELPFVVYRKPMSDERRGRTRVKAILQKDPELYWVRTYNESGFVFAPFDNRKQVVLIPTQQSDVLEASIQSFAQSTAALFGASNKQDEIAPNSFVETLNHSTDKQRAAHIELVTKTVEVLKNSELDKVVLSRREEVPHGKAPLELFSDLLEAYPTAFVYLWHHPKVGLWLGATPESLVHMKGKEFKTMAFAGTQVFDGDMLVSWGQKELQEQQYVTDSILDNLRDLGLEPEIQAYHGELYVAGRGTYTSRAGNLLHLRTDIFGSVKAQSELASIVKALHPTPAVGGLPKEASREFILNHELYDREFYTGFLGELNLQEHQPRARSRRNVENLAYGTVRKQSALYVNLRCMKLEGQKAVIFVGGGITSDSDPKAEWEETVNKSKTMKRVLR